jgi:hypothetical protein
MQTSHQGRKKVSVDCNLHQVDRRSSKSREPRKVALSPFEMIRLVFPAILKIPLIDTPVLNVPSRTNCILDSAAVQLELFILFERQSSSVPDSTWPLSQ